jgi:5-methylcytosine-specific restriction endonuclease McrA
MTEAQRQEVRRNAGFQCEYSRLREQDWLFSAFHLDHVVALQHGGSDEPDNLAWSCQQCNLLKGTNLSGIDPDTGAVVSLFHPRKKIWSEHFRTREARIEGLTACGRATVWLLEMNSAERLQLRALVRERNR